MREGCLGIWNGSIHLPFLLVSKCALRTRKSKARKADLREEESFYTRTHGEAHFTLCSSTSGYPRPLFIAFIGENVEEQSYVPLVSHFYS